MLKAVRLLLLLAGVALAAYLVAQHSRDIGESLRQVGWGFATYMAASFVVYALDSWGWRLAFVEGQPHTGFWKLFSIRMAGEAVNKVTPLASMGGEPLKGYLLARTGTSTTHALASVAIAKNVMTLSQIAFIFCGIGLAWPALPGRSGLLIGMAVFPGLIFTAMMVTALLDLRLRRQRARGIDAEAPGEGKKPRMQFVIDLWSQVADFFWTNPRGFALSFLFFFLGWAAASLELMAAAHALGFPLSLHDALALEALLASVNMATFFIPANAGSQEGGFAYLAPLWGVSAPHAVALAVLRRCRDVIWVAYGLAYLAITEGRILFRPAVEAPGPAA